MSKYMYTNNNNGVSRRKSSRFKGRLVLQKSITYLFLSVVALTIVFPYLWMVATSFKLPGQSYYEFSLFPNPATLQHYKALIEAGWLTSWYVNTSLVAIVGTVSVAFFTSLAGFALAKYSFPGRDVIFAMFLSTIMIPEEMLIIPWFVGIAKVGWTDSLAAVLAPRLITTFGIFVMRQFLMEIPDDLLDSGRVDGVSEFGLFWRVCLPLAKPALVVVSIFSFLSRWNEFLWPVIVITSRDKLLLQPGLHLLSSLEGATNWGGIMAGAAMASVPMLVIFIIFQRHIIKGISLTGLKA